MRCYFINRPDSPYFESDLFRRVLLYLQEGTHQARLKQTGRMFLMVVDHIKSMQDARRFLQAMHQHLFPNKIATPLANAISEK
jgi:transcription-repair coupling factor (superfamily II helicase)